MFLFEKYGDITESLYTETPFIVLSGLAFLNYRIN